MAERPIPTCLRCSSAMDAGFMFDVSHGAIRQSRWVPGKPEAGFWTGEVTMTQADRGLRITTFRCPRCGYLESYAPNT